MSAKSFFGMIKNVSGLISELEDSGMHVEIGDDFSEYRSYRLAQVDRNAMYPMFDVASSYIDETNGFWVCGFNDDGDLIHTQAVRLLDLKDKSLRHHLKTHRHKYITPNTTPDPDATFFNGPRALDAITGKVVYHGEFWLPGRGLGGPRSQGATPLLSRIVFELVHKLWEPDFVYALVPKRLAERGAHLRYGYTHCEPGEWVGPDQQVTEEDYMIWMSARDMANAVSQRPKSLRDIAKMTVVQSSLVAAESKA